MTAVIKTRKKHQHKLPSKSHDCHVYITWYQRDFSVNFSFFFFFKTVSQPSSTFYSLSTTKSPKRRPLTLQNMALAQRLIPSLTRSTALYRPLVSTNLCRGVGLRYASNESKKPQPSIDVKTIGVPMGESCWWLKKKRNPYVVIGMF